VRVKNVPSVDHTRLPGFLRNKTGTVETVYEGAYMYLCDTGPDGIGAAMLVYCVRFDPDEIWPGNAEPNFNLYADLYANYVEAAASAVTAKAA
jgi:nitrile hydratase